MLTFTVEELIRFLSNWTMTFFEGAKRSDDIVFSHYYSFFKRPVLVREHQVESLYVMVQNRDSSDNKKPSFSRFAKWEFGGFIVDSKTIYMASKPVKALLQSSDFIDDMDVFEKLDSIRIPLFRKNIPADPAMFQDKDTVDKAVRNACSAFLFGTRCNEFSNLIRTMYPLNDDDVIHYLSSPSDWAEETSSVITASNGTASRIYYMARLIAIDRMSELFLTFYEHDSADPKDITNVCKSMMDAVEPYKVVTLVMDDIDDKKMGEHLEVDCPSHLIRDADVLRRKGISVTRIFVNHIQMEKSEYDVLIRHLNDPDSINDEYQISDVVFAADNTIVSVLWEGNSKDGVSGTVTLAVNGKTVYATKSTKVFCNHWVIPYNGAEYHVLVDVLPKKTVLEETIYVSKPYAERIKKYLRGAEVQGDGSSLSKTAKFSDGFEMDIRCCGGKDDSWTEAILYDDTGREVAVTEPCDGFTGCWELKDEDTNTVYRAHVMTKSNLN